jgi:hypothetical protein
MAEHWHTNDQTSETKYVHTTARELLSYLEGCGISYTVGDPKRGIYAHAGQYMAVWRCRDGGCPELAEELADLQNR